jgi:uncharacterized protein YaaN involved in tellurite resistance
MPQEKIKQKSKEIVSEINRIIYHLQQAKKEAKGGLGTIDNSINDARYKLSDLQSKIWSLWESC